MARKASQGSLVLTGGQGRRVMWESQVRDSGGYAMQVAQEPQAC